MVSSCPAGLTGFECSFAYFIGAVLVLAAILFRKNIANDLLGMPFSLVGGAAGGVLSYLIILIIFHSLKFGTLAGICGLLIFGFLVGDKIGDGEA